ncbi:MAG TPA: hypothetical protein VN207_07585, partial [Ktedonobacteraceae bacterium]|nr:hypothetical protein [Ktedonobacteraceae bacterium]
KSFRTSPLATKITSYGGFPHRSYLDGQGAFDCHACPSLRLHLRGRLPQSALTKKYQSFDIFFDEQPLSPESKYFLLQQALERYETKRGSNVISPLILHRQGKLVEQVDTTFDDKIAKMQEQQKRVAEDLRLEDWDGLVFLKSQRYKTNYYAKRPNLVCLQQKGPECGIIATQMVAAGHNKAYVNKWDKVEKMVEAFEYFHQELEKEKYTHFYTYPMVLKKIGHPIEYRLYAYQKEDWMSPSDNQKYSSYMGYDPQDITVDQLRSGIKRSKEPIITSVERRLDREAHVILIDATEIRNGEEYIICRDPGPNEGRYSVNWKDFVEVWGGYACIPVGE